jgi:hypothetical protein
MAIAALFGSNPIKAQTALEKDLEVGKNLLSTALRMDRTLMRAANNVNEQYIPGVGAVYTLYNSPLTVMGSRTSAIEIPLIFESRLNSQNQSQEIEKAQKALERAQQEVLRLQSENQTREVVMAQQIAQQELVRAQQEVVRAQQEAQEGMLKAQQEMIRTQREVAERGIYSSNIVLRGRSSVNSNNNPVIIVDGKAVPGNSLANINLQEVEKMEVLKGESAEGLGGAQGQNAGVIKITTRNPDNEIKVDLDIEFMEVEEGSSAYFNPVLRAMDDFSINFMADNSFLFAGLPKNEEFIIIHQERTNTSNISGVYVIGYSNRSSNARREYRLSVSDIQDYEAGKIDREALMERITVRSEESKPVEQDLILFANVLHSLYPQMDGTNTFFSTSPPMIESMPLTAIAFNWKLYSSYPLSNDQYRLPNFTEAIVSLDVRNKILEKHYPEFISGLKEKILDYGRTIRSLNEEQSVQFKISLPECNCKMPSEVNLEMKMKDVMDYTKGNLSRADALNRIRLKEN